MVCVCVFDLNSNCITALPATFVIRWRAVGYFRYDTIRYDTILSEEAAPYMDIISSTLIIIISLFAHWFLTVNRRWEIAAANIRLKQIFTPKQIFTLKYQVGCSNHTRRTDIQKESSSSSFMTTTTPPPGIVCGKCKRYLSPA